MNQISTPYYKALDFILIFIVCSLAYWVRFQSLALPLYYFLPTTIFAIISTFTLNVTGFYQETNSAPSSEQAFAAISGLIVAGTLTATCLYLTKTGEEYSRIWLVTIVIFSFIALQTSRLVLKHVFHISTNSKHIVLVGNDRNAEFVEKKIMTMVGDKITVVKYFKFGSDDLGRNLKSLFDVAEFIEEYRKTQNLKNPISEIWVTQDVFSQFDHIDLTTALADSSVSLVYVPTMPDLLNSINQEQLKVIAGIPTINSSFNKNQKAKEFFKFIEDQIIAWSTLIILSPLFILISLFIKLDSPGAVFFRQHRYGLSGKKFQIWKFRTMFSDNNNQKFKQATKNDPRVTRVGNFLRKTSLDELPQLFNVILGEMSIVGPRPHPTVLNEQYRSEIYQYMQRHKVKPGITGLAQIRGFRGETEDPELMKKRIKSDFEYVENWSVALDIKIILLTAVHLLQTDRAY